MSTDPTWFAILGLTEISLGLWAWSLLDEASRHRHMARENAARQQAA